MWWYVIGRSIQYLPQRCDVERERDGSLAIRDPLQRAWRDAERREPRRTAERLLRTGVGVVDAPRGRGDHLTAERRDAVRQQERVAGAAVGDHRPEILHGVANTRGGFRVDHADQLRVGMLRERVGHLLERHDLAERRGELDEVGTGAPCHLGDAGAEESGVEHEHGVAGLHQVRHPRLHARGAARAEAEREAVGAAPERFEPLRQIQQQVPEVRVEVSVDRQLHGLEDLGMHVRRARPAQEAVAGIDRRDAW